jgi:hypothetical protein
VARLRGERWAEETGPGDLAAIFSLGEELIAAGPRGQIFARRQGGWLAVDAVDGAAYEGLWASGPKDIWAVGSQVRHFDGSAWTSIAPADGPGTTRCKSAPAAGVRGDSPDRAKAGYAGPERTEGTFATLPMALHAVWGAGPGEVWAVGDEGAALRCARGPRGK